VRRAALRAGVLALAVLSVAAVPQPAGAAVRGRIVSAEAKDGRLTVVFGAAGLAEGQTIDPKSVTMTLDGQSVPVTVTTAANAPTTVVRRVVLAIDTSGSMATDNRIGAARNAATAYLNRVPADVQVGLVTFSTRAAVRVRPTTDRATVRAAIASLRPTGDTALYEAVSLAAEVLGAEGDRSILVLSDGRDEGSRTTLAAARAQLRRAKIPLNGVLTGDVGARAALVSLSEAAGGRVVNAQAAGDLTRSFEQAARDSERDVVLVAEIPQRYSGGEASVTVNGRAGDEQLEDTVLAVNLVSGAAADPSTFGPQAVEPLDGPFSSKTPLYAGLVALFLGVGAVLAFALNGIASRPEDIRRRLRPYGASGERGRQEPEPSRGVRETAMGLADEIVKRRGLEETLAKRLDGGGIPLKPAEWLILHIGIAILLPLFVLLVSNVNVALTVVALLLGILGPLGYLTVKAAMRTRKFLAQLPDTLQLMSGSLSAGYSLPQAIDAVARQGAPPMSDELRKSLVEARLGAPIEDALDDVADRMNSKDFSWVVMAIRIQRQVGGNLAEVLATTAATLRERERLRRQVQVLSAEGRLSAYILFGLPVFFALYLLAVRPGYLEPLVTDKIGWVLLGGMGILLTVGAFWLRKVVKVDI